MVICTVSFWLLSNDKAEFVTAATKLVCKSFLSKLRRRQLVHADAFGHCCCEQKEIASQFSSDCFPFRIQWPSDLTADLSLQQPAYSKGEPCGIRWGLRAPENASKWLGFSFENPIEDTFRVLQRLMTPRVRIRIVIQIEQQISVIWLERSTWILFDFDEGTTWTSSPSRRGWLASAKGWKK